MDAGILCNKEMVDLLMRIKRHAKARHGIAIGMSDGDVMEKLLTMASIKDDLLQGMLQYFMVLAGKDWSRKYEKLAHNASGENTVLVFARKMKDALVHDNAPQGLDETHKNTEKVRYYRGQPIYG